MNCYRKEIKIVLDNFSGNFYISTIPFPLQFDNSEPQKVVENGHNKIDILCGFGRCFYCQIHPLSHVVTTDSE